MTALDRLSIRQRLLFAGLLPAALVALLVSAYYSWNASRELDFSLDERGLAIVSFLAPASEYGLISGNRETLDALLQAALTQRQVHAAAVIDVDGKTLSISGAMHPPELDALMPVEAAAPLPRRGAMLRFAAPVWRTPVDLGELFEVTAPGRHERVGWVYAELDTSDLARRKTLLLAANLALALAALVATSVLAIRLARTMSKRVEALVGAVDAMAKGLHATRVRETSGGEIGALERGFNQMAGALEDVHRDMQARIDSATAQLRHLADHDPLSGLPNRRAFERETARALADGSGGHALCFMDLDRFKQVNDTCGHQAGDELLSRIGTLLREHVRDQDMVARVGGDEFALLLRNCGLEHARSVAESLRATVAAFRFPWEGREFSIGASIGLVLLDGSHASLVQALGAADRACYAAKRSGRNQVCESDARAPTPEGETEAQPLTLAGALQESRLRLLALPAIPIEPGATSWAQVFMRIDDANADESMRFAQRCHRSGDGLALDVWQVRACCQLLKERQRPVAGMVRLSFGLGDASICQSGDFVAAVEDALASGGIAPAALCFEVSADLAAQYPGEVTALARRLRRLGAGLAVAGYRDHAPSCLRALRPDFVKLSLDDLRSEYEEAQATAVAVSAARVAVSLGARLVVCTATGDMAPELRSMATYLQGDGLAPEQALDGWLLESTKPADKTGRRQA